MASNRRIHHRSCPLCEAICGLEFELEGDRIVSVRGDAADPFSGGHLCPKGPALQGLHEDPDRLRRPLLRTDDGWKEIAWNEAFDRAEAGITQIQREHGRDAMAMYFGNPSVHSLGSVLFVPEFLRALGTKNAYSASSVDQLPQMLAAYEVFGHRLLMPVPDIDHTDHMLIFGGNPVVSNGSIMTAPNVKGRLEAILGRGGKVVVVDPRRTETARLASEHHFIRPGTDAFALLAMVRTLFDEDLVDLGALTPHIRGLEAAREAVMPYTAERAAATTGIDAETIRELARELARARSAVVYGRVGVSIQAFGTLCAWAIDLLNILTGNLDRRGGAMFSQPAFDIIGGPKPMQIGRGGFDRWRSRVRDLPEFGRELPVAVLAEEILEPGEGQIRGLITNAGNPVLSTPNGLQLDTALASLSFMLSIDFYVNETTRHANLILPPTGPLERSQYDLAFNVFAVHNVAKYSPAMIEPEADQRHDWQIFAELERRLRRAHRDKITARLAVAVRERMTPERILDLGLRLGPWGLSLEDLRKQPHGVELGPLQPCLPERLPSRQGDRFIELAPPRIVADLPRLDAAERPADPGELRLIGRRQLRSNNSWMHNVPKLMAGKARCTLLMHPADADARGIAQGARVRLSSRVGQVEVDVELDDDLMPGVVCMPHGFGHDRAGVRLETARAHAGSSVNDVTDERFIDALSGNAALSGVPVSVELAAAAQ